MGNNWAPPKNTTAAIVIAATAIQIGCEVTPFDIILIVIVRHVRRREDSAFIAGAKIGDFSLRTPFLQV